MKQIAIFIVSATLALAAVSGCQPSDRVEPEDESTGNAPDGPEVIFKFNAADAPAFLDSNLKATNGVTATYAVSSGVLAPIPANGAFSAAVGADADLLGGVGFGTYPNPDIRGPGVAWEGADRFRSELTASIVLSQPGDAVKFCRSAATTCVTFMLDAMGNGLAVMTMAANVPDTEIGEISPGISASIRGTGANGLTIAPTNPATVTAPFTATAGVATEVRWTISRGGSENSLDYSVTVGGTEIASGNTLVDLVGAIATTGGVALQFDKAPGGGGPLEIDYSYAFDGETPIFTDILVAGVDISPQPDLIRTPLFVYPTLDPEIELLTLSGNAGAKHAVQEADAVLGTTISAPGQEPKTTVVSVAFNGDDFVGTGLEGLVDQGGAGGGFYPSPTLCYSGVFASLKDVVETGAQRLVRRQMFAVIANGVLAADVALPAVATTLGLPYTRIGGTDGAIAIGTDYADSNLATNITTSVMSTYAATLNLASSQTFITELNAIIAAIEGAGMTPDASLKALQIGMTTPPGSKDGVVNGAGVPVLDNGTTICNGYDCQVAVNVRDLILGTNDAGNNGAGVGVPGLGSTCLWGVTARPEIPAIPASLDGDGDTTDDTPAFAAIPAAPAIAPAREIAADSINTLVLGVYGNFISQAFGPTVPASNFSLSMKVGDTTSGTAPAVSSIVISR